MKFRLVNGRVFDDLMPCGQNFCSDHVRLEVLTIQTSMLHNSSQFFRVSNTREDFHTSTRRCSKLFAFLGPAKPGCGTCLSGHKQELME